MGIVAQHTWFHLGPLSIGQTVVTTWGLMLLLGLSAYLSTRHTSDLPGALQTAVEGIVEAIRSAIAGVLPDDVDRVLPFVGTLWIFLAVANLTGILPGLSSPTADLAATSALAITTFFFVHWAGIRSAGLRGYLAHYVSPNPIMLPFEIISELSRTVTLAVRLFGNMASLELAVLIVIGIAGFLAPVPLLALHVVEALIQAYIFGMLALVYVAGAVQVQHARLKGTT
jgi:F-type H+-transporting ATPase subunit a